MSIEGGSSRSHCVEESFWKALDLSFDRLLMMMMMMMIKNVILPRFSSTGLEVCHPRCVCENWKRYVVKHNYVN